MSDLTSSSIVIKAPREAVMAVIINFPAYPEWSGGFRSAEVTEPGPDGRARQVRFVLDTGLLKDKFELVYDWDADKRASYRLAQPTAIMAALTGSYVLADHEGGTEVINELTVGLRIPMLGMIKRRLQNTIVNQALKGLKKQVESLGDA